MRTFSPGLVGPSLSLSLSERSPEVLVGKIRDWNEAKLPDIHLLLSERSIATDPGCLRHFPNFSQFSFFVTCSLASFAKVWCPFLLNQLRISGIPNPLALQISVAALSINETFVCNRSEGYDCVRKGHGGTPIVFLESEKKMVSV